MQQPFLTIGIASYNYATCLQRAFDQILAQQFTDVEILYCDDGSTDGSQEIIKGFMNAHPDMQIRLIEGDHDGLLANRNRILDNARGEYLLICDADDYMLAGCLTELCKAAREHHADCVIGGFCETNGDGQVIKQHVPDQNSCKWLYTWHHAQIYRTQIYREHHLRFNTLPDDACYLWPLHLYCKNTVFVPLVLYSWVRHQDSTSRDVTLDSDWSPVTIWHRLSSVLAAFREQHVDVLTEDDRVALDYYLYKWYYLNVADLSLLRAEDRQQASRMLRWDMHAAFPQYMQLTALARTMQIGDSLFARLMVLACWMAEHVGLLSLVYRARAYQDQRRA